VQAVSEAFRHGIDRRWSRLCVGGGGLWIGEGGLRLALASSRAGGYADAQFDDCQGRRRGELPWRAPLRLRLRARLSGQVAGTAGFGFWNNPAAWPPALPQALWFLCSSPPGEIALADGVPGWGWKAACIDATGAEALAWAPAAPAVLLLNRLPRFRRAVWPRVQRALRVREALLPTPPSRWCDYELDWLRDRALWRVDGVVVLETDRPPRGPLGFVAWVDNQWAAATPEGRVGWGLCPLGPPQWLEIASLSIAPRAV
jgi:hypothetical protein